MKFKIIHDRGNCIGCTACANLCPKFWELSGQDGLADIVDGEKKEDGSMELAIDEKDFECNMEAAEGCPVNVIHITNQENGEELI
jgi:ferredoxin